MKIFRTIVLIVRILVITLKIARRDRAVTFTTGKDDLSKKKSRQEPKQIYVPTTEKENTEIVDFEMSSPKEGNINTSN
jgi:FtsZ-interacting cell division protein ZipA